MVDNKIKDSDGVYGSYGVNRSYGVNESDGVNGSKGVNYSNGVNKSNGVSWSDGVDSSRGVSWSNGVSWSYGILNCYGVDNAIFLADKPREYTIFGKQVSEERKHEVMNNLLVKLNGWYPKFNNAFELYLKVDSDWEKVDASKITSTLEDWEQPYEAWKDMPQEAIDYLVSLPEFDADIFKRVTGIEVKNQKEKPEVPEIIELNGKKYKLID